MQSPQPWTINEPDYISKMNMLVSYQTHGIYNYILDEMKRYRQQRAYLCLDQNSGHGYGNKWRSLVTSCRNLKGFHNLVPFKGRGTRHREPKSTVYVFRIRLWGLQVGIHELLDKYGTTLTRKAQRKASLCKPLSQYNWTIWIINIIRVINCRIPLTDIF